MRDVDEMVNYLIWRKTGNHPSEVDLLPASVEPIRKMAKDLLEKLKDAGIEFFSVNDDGYPYLLKEVQKPPYGIFCLGDCGVLKGNMISIVGTRRSTGYGESQALRFSKALAKKFVVVSGMAYGIDSKAHEGAMETGWTVAVLASGVDVPTPKGNMALYERILRRGCVVSPYPIGEGAKRYRFVERNSIIAGLSVGTIVVEAPKKSGSLITASMAADFGRDVFAVPGDVDKYRSEGTNHLIKQGAVMVTDPEDVLDYYGFESDEKEISDEVYELVRSGVGSAEEISEVSGMPLEEVLARLSELEMEGLVYRDSSFNYRPL